MVNDNFERFLNESLKASELEIDTPISEVEQKIAEKMYINRLKKRQNRKQFMATGVILIALLGTSSLLLLPKPVNAFKEQLIQRFTKLSGNISVFMSNSNQSQPSGKMEKEVAAFQKKVPFKILIPQYIPEGIKFKSITKSPTDENTMVILSFASDTSKILFTQTKVSNNFGYSININGNQGESHQIQIGRHIGNMLIFKDGSCSLTWLTDDYIMCEISGNISSKQASDMASSI